MAARKYRRWEHRQDPSAIRRRKSLLEAQLLAQPVRSPASSSCRSSTLVWTMSIPCSRPR